MESDSYLEKVSGNLGTSIVATLIAASSGTYLAPLLPVLASSLASGRYQKKVTDALSDINSRLHSHSKAIEKLSDEQFRLIGDIVGTILKTANNEKIEILKGAAVNSALNPHIEEHEASVVARVLRDISVDELKYLACLNGVETINLFGKGNQLDHEGTTIKDGAAFLNTDSYDAELLSGLINLGLIIPDGTGLSASMFYRVSPVVKILIKIIVVPNIEARKI